MSDTLDHVHETHLSAPLIELTPSHPDRKNSPAYERAHKFLIHEKKQGCHICGITIDDLSDPAKNLSKATSMQSHHYPVEWSLAPAVDPKKLHQDFPQVFDEESLMAFIDTPANLMVLCSTHHLDPEHGVHHLLTQDFVIQRYLRDGYTLVASRQDATASAEAHDDAIEQAAGLEQKEGQAA